MNDNLPAFINNKWTIQPIWRYLKIIIINLNIYLKRTFKKKKSKYIFKKKNISKYILHTIK